MAIVSTTRLLFCSCLVWTLVMATSPTNSNATYNLVFSRYIRRGHPLTASIWLSGVSQPVNMRLELVSYEGRRLQLGKTFLINPSESAHVLHLNVSKHLPEGPSIYLHAFGWGGLEFDRFMPLSLTSDSHYIHIITDKVVYKPGQTVRFLALPMASDLTTVDEDMEVTILDPYNNVMGRWSRKQGDRDSGVLTGEMVTSLTPRLGQWQIFTKMARGSRTKDFTIQNYATPQVEFNIELEAYVPYSRLWTVVTVSAKYLNGVPVQGWGNLITQNYVYYRRSSSRNYKTLEKAFKLDHRGEARVNFTKEELAPLYGYTSSVRHFHFRGRRLNVTANFTVNVTNDVFKKTVIHLFSYRPPGSLLFIPPTPYYIQPGQPLNIHVRATWDKSITVSETRADFMLTYTYIQHFPNWTEEHRITRRQKIQLDSDGVAKLDLNNLPVNTTYAYVRVSFENWYTTRYFRLSRSTPPTSPSYYARLTVNAPELKVGNMAEVKLDFNKGFGSIHYQIYVKNLIVMANSQVRTVMSNTTTFSFMVTDEMFPSANLLVYFTAEDGRMEASKLTIRPERPINRLKIEFPESKAEPSSMAQLRLEAAPGSTVFFFGADKRVMTDLRRRDYQLGYLSRTVTNLLNSRPNTLPYVSRSPHNVVRSAGGHILTNREYHSVYYSPYHYRTGYHRTYSSYRTSERLGPHPVPPGRGNRRPLSPAELLFRYIPDTWLWNSVYIRSQGSAVVTVPTPDTLGNQEVIGLAIHPTLGVALPMAPAELRLTKRLYLSTDLPRSAVLGETVCFRTHVTNFDRENVTVSLGINNNADQFQHVIMRRSGTNGSQVQEVYVDERDDTMLGTIMPELSVVTTLCIKFRAVGDITVRLVARHDEATEEVVRTITIKNVGVAHTKTYPVLIELTPDSNFSQTVTVFTPTVHVPGSLKVSVKVAGDPLALVRENSEDLLEMPYGCGEQNMVHFTTSVHLIPYLYHTGQLPPNDYNRARDQLTKRLQSEMYYQRYDGGFSAFGNWDKSGSMWMTALVTKGLADALVWERYAITIEFDVLNRAVGWMTENQNAEGSFREPGRITHPSLQGKTREKNTRMTSYVAISLLTLNHTASPMMSSNATQRMRSSLALAVRYLERQVSRVQGDAYTACILAYALTLAGSDKAEDAVTAMNSMAVTQGNMKYWSGGAKAQKIEMTSYALMTLMKRGNTSDAIPVFRWLVQQRGPKGGFVTTHDTALGVEALTTTTPFALGRTFSPISTTVEWTEDSVTKTRSMTIAPDSVLRVHDFPISITNQEVTFSAQSTVPEGGRLFALAYVVVEYNVVAGSSNTDAFSAVARVQNETDKSLILKTCVRRPSSQSSVSQGAMVMAELELPSGYQVVRSTSDYSNASNVEITQGQVNLYYYASQLSLKKNCAMIHLKKRETIAHLSSPIIRLYDYYNPSTMYTTTYSLTQRGPCDVVPVYANCSAADAGY